MKFLFKNILTKLYNKVVLYNNPFYFYGIAKDDYSISGQLVTLKRINLSVNRFTEGSIIKGYPWALIIHESINGKFSIKNENILLQIGDLKFQINSAEELLIIYEVFIQGVYKYHCLKETVFVDVGMNSAITTLFYAQNPLVKKIYSFELFNPTFLLGKQNIKLNENYAHKIEALNYGLSDKNFQSTLDYSLSKKGRMGLKGLPYDEKFFDVKKENVFVKDIKDIFDSIISESGDMDITVKMDCEGEEFNLIHRLSESRLLEKITILMIEWHYKNPSEIEQQLRAFDFHIFSQTLSSMDSGMIYASKRKTEVNQ